MNNSSMIIEWNDSNKKEVEEAKGHYMKARTEGRLITDMEGNAIQHFKPSLLGFTIKETELGDHEFAVRVFDETGDRRIIWNMTDPDQVKEAAKLFDEYMTKGWRAYAVDASGKTRLRIHKFDAEREEVLFEDKSVSEILGAFTEIVKNEAKPIITKAEKIANFLSSFKNTKLVPRTYPG